MVLWFQAAVAANANAPNVARWPNATSVFWRRSALWYTPDSSPRLSTPSTLLLTNSRRLSTEKKVSPIDDTYRAITLPPDVWLMWLLGPWYQMMVRPVNVSIWVTPSIL